MRRPEPSPSPAPGRSTRALVLLASAWLLLLASAAGCSSSKSDEGGSAAEEPEAAAQNEVAAAEPPAGAGETQAAEAAPAVAAQTEPTDPATDPPADAAAVQVPPPPPDAAFDWSTLLPAATMDQEIVAGLQAMVDHCGEIRADGCVVYQCGDHMSAFDQIVERKGRIAALETMSGALFSSDDRMVTVAAHRLGSSLFAYLDGRETRADAIDATLVRRLLDAVGRLEKCRATSVIKPTIHAAMLAGIRTPLYEAIEKHPAEYMKTVAYPELMRFGRAEAFPQVAALVERTGDDAARAAALSALRSVPHPTAEEKAVWCPFAVSYLDDAAAPVAAEAGHFAVICGGASLDALLDEGERRLAAGTFAPPFSQVFREPCFSSGFGDQQTASDEQCARNYAFLEKVANTETVAAEVRGQSLWNIYYQRRNQASLDLMVRYLEHPVREVRTQALDAARSLVEDYGLSGTLPQDPKTQMALAFADCRVEGHELGASELAAVALDPEGRLVVADKAGGVRRFTVALDAGCALTLDTGFGEGGVLQVEGLPDSVSFGRERGAVSGSRAVLTDADGRNPVPCAEASGVAVAPDGALWGYGAGRKLGRLTVTADACTLEPVAHPFEHVSAIGFAGELVLVGGSVTAPVDGARMQVVAFDAATWEERFRLGTRYLTEDGFGWVHAVSPCSAGICVLDGNYKSVTVWQAADGRFLTRIELWRDLAEFGTPGTPSLAFTGAGVGLLAANDSGSSRVRRIDGIALPGAQPDAGVDAAPAPVLDLAEVTKGLGPECTRYATEVVELCNILPAATATACDAWLDGIATMRASGDAAEPACAAGLEGVRQTRDALLPKR